MLGAGVLFTGLLALACAVMSRGLALAAVSDIIGALLLLFALIAFASAGRACTGRMRLFWWLQAAGWGLWFGDQLVWIAFDLVMQKKVPAMYPADALLFLAGAPMLAGLLLRPHRQPSERSLRLGALDFLLLALWWLYLYVSFVVCWQYVSPNEDAYNLNFDILSAAGSILLAGVLALFCFQTSRAWKKFYAFFCAAVVFNGICFYSLNHAIEANTYFTGSWYDIPYAMSFAIFTGVALAGRSLSPTPETTADESYASWMSNLATIAVLSLPVLALFALLDPRLPPETARFRVMVTLATMFLMALLIFIQHHRLNAELKRTNTVLEEASLTDPLTGLRNRRYVSATIEADALQAQRAYADGHDPRTRDLVFYLIDVDNFKEINDRFGHDIGDRVLIEMARRLSSSIRHSDVLVRWGGEEFLIVSRYTDRREAELLAERVLAAIADTPFVLRNPEETITRTCSMGWAAFPWVPNDARAVGYEEVLTLADRGLNQAKRAGKNRAVGMFPAASQPQSHGLGSLQSPRIQVDVLAVDGPRQPRS
jgi:diguanylate cyclase (GGDEF)-like protein